jgi:hypothetical protein
MADPADVSRVRITRPAAPETLGSQTGLRVFTAGKPGSGVRRETSS